MGVQVLVHVHTKPHSAAVQVVDSDGHPVIGTDGKPKIKTEAFAYDTLKENLLRL